MDKLPDNEQEAREIAREAMKALRMLQYGFEVYMTSHRWDACCAEGIYSDDGTRAVSMFLEYVESGIVTDDDGKELEE